ncbi:NAD-dependent epimerase/dehydratase family protein [Nonomuraea rosea]|uniref:NAD-dependent epimerase/dehydratase family protein n=1 Tax=Nonomuraea rosea TaxID=638574 RepID=UPI0031EC0681
MGGAGFLGTHLCRRLAKEGHEVSCIDNLSTSSHQNLAEIRQTPGIEFIRHDIVEPLPLSGPIDIVFHLASPASPQDYLRLPVETLLAGSAGTLNALQLATEKRARFLLASTSEIYGDPLIHPQSESYFGNVNSIGPRSVYDEGKRYAEALTQAYRRKFGTDTIIVRIFNTYGPRMRADDGRVVPAFISQASAGIPLTIAGDGRQTRSLCYVDDLIEGICLAAYSSASGPINLGNPSEISVKTLAVTVKKLMRSSSPLQFIPRPEDDPERRRPDICRAAAELDWVPTVGIDDGLSRTIDWFASSSKRSGDVAKTSLYALD